MILHATLIHSMFTACKIGVLVEIANLFMYFYSQENSMHYKFRTLQYYTISIDY